MARPVARGYQPRIPPAPKKNSTAASFFEKTC
jgi:hypothetical protein